jgi:glycosyltransferase involved in cell wall biosynthesis
MRVLVSILTSGKPDLLALCYASVTQQERGTGAVTYDVVVVVNSTDAGYAETVRNLLPGVEVVVTDSNGRPGKGHNSVLANFRDGASSARHDYCVLVDGDDFLYPRALRRIERYLAYEPDVLLLTFHDKLSPARAEHEAGVPHFSMDDSAVWFYNLTDVTVPRWYETKGSFASCPFGRDVTGLNTPARPLVFSRRALAFDLAYDENMLLFDDFVVFCKCLERAVLGDLRVFGVVDSHLYLYNTTSDSATSRFFGTGPRDDENARFRASVRGRFLAIRGWDLRALRLLELGQDDEPDNIVAKHRFVRDLVPKMGLTASIMPCDNADAVANHARRSGAPGIAREMELILESRRESMDLPVAITVCVGDSDLLALTLAQNAPNFSTWYVISRPDDEGTAALLARAPPNVRRVVDTKVPCAVGEGVVVTIEPGVFLPRNFLCLIPSRPEPGTVYVASEHVFASLENFRNAKPDAFATCAALRLYAPKAGSSGSSDRTRAMHMTVARLAFRSAVVEA